MTFLEPRPSRHPLSAIAFAAVAAALAAGATDPSTGTFGPPAVPLLQGLAEDDECVAVRSEEAPDGAPVACAVQALQRRGAAAAARGGFVAGQASEGSHRGGQQAIGHAQGEGPSAATNPGGRGGKATQARQQPSSRAAAGHKEGKGLHPVVQVQGIEGGVQGVCVRKSELALALKDSVKTLRKGLPAWKAKEVPSRVADVSIAFLIQAAWKQQLPVLRRVFDRLYSDKDLFLYMVDSHFMHPKAVSDVLPKPLPRNVLVKASVHAPYFLWPRVEVVLHGLRALLQEGKHWDFAIHLSESDYPVHHVSWIRQALAAQRTTNFVHLIPRCHVAKPGRKVARDDWFWWSQVDSVASCNYQFVAGATRAVPFPTEAVEQLGLKFARGPEWVALTRELVQYALSDELLPFRRLIGMHLGSDEIFWQTLVLNIPGFRQNVSDRGWFIKWGHGKTSHSPDILTKANEDSIEQSRGHFFFMRKVSANDSTRLLDDIDNLGDPPSLARADSPSHDFTASAVACPKGTGVLTQTKTCRSRVTCGCPPFKDQHCATTSVMKHPYCLKSSRHCAICEGTWC